MKQEFVDIPVITEEVSLGSRLLVVFAVEGKRQTLLVVLVTETVSAFKRSANKSEA